MQKEFSKFALSVALFLVAGYCAIPEAYSQGKDSLLTVYNNQTIHSFGNVYMKGGNRLTFRDLEYEFKPGTASDLYGKSQKKLALSKVLSVVSVVTLIGSAVLRKNQNDGGFGLLAVGIGINFFNGRIRKKSTELVDQALWIRNKEILFNVRE